MSKSVTVSIDICSNCKQHEWCTRHNEATYLSLATELQSAVAGAYPNAAIKVNAVGGTRMGSFQVSCNDVLLFSKLSLGYFPHITLLVQRIEAFLADSAEGNNLKNYWQSKSPVKINSIYNNRSPTKTSSKGSPKLKETTKIESAHGETNAPEEKQHNQAKITPEKHKAEKSKPVQSIASKTEIAQNANQPKSSEQTATKIQAPPPKAEKKEESTKAVKAEEPSKKKEEPLKKQEDIPQKKQEEQLPPKKEEHKQKTSEKKIQVGKQPAHHKDKHEEPTAKTNKTGKSSQKAINQGAPHQAQMVQNHTKKEEEHKVDKPHKQPESFQNIPHEKHAEQPAQKAISDIQAKQHEAKPIPQSKKEDLKPKVEHEAKPIPQSKKEDLKPKVEHEAVEHVGKTENVEATKVPEHVEAIKPAGVQKADEYVDNEFTPEVAEEISGPPHE